MSLLPWVQRPCPYLDRLDAVIEGDFCRKCKREVHDITDLDEAGRAAFFEACNGKACVRYRFDAMPAAAAALIAASAAIAVVPAAGAAPSSHHARRVPHPPRPIHIQPVPMMTAGIIAPPPALPRPQPDSSPVKSGHPASHSGSAEN